MTYYSAGSTTENYTLLRLDGGFYDYCYKTGTPTYTFAVYKRDTTSASGTYWSTANATTTTSATNSAQIYNWAEARTTYELQKAEELFDASFETVNIFFDQEALQADPIVEMFLVSAVSFAQLKVSYSPDGNYTLSSPTAADIYTQGSEEETGSLDNTTIRYKGSKQIIVKAIQFDARDAYSVKFKVEAYLSDGTNTYRDDIRIKAIHVLPNDVLFIGGETYA